MSNYINVYVTKKHCFVTLSDVRMGCLAEEGEYSEEFSLDGCYIKHQGVTGRAVLNDPADGDIIFTD